MIDIIVNMVSFLSGLLHLSPDMLVVVFGAALAVSEALALIPFLKSNSIMQLVVNTLKKLAGKK